MNKELEKSILSTLVYFDIFDYPLTLVEIWRYLYQPFDSKNHQSTFSIFDVQKALEFSPELKRFISHQNDFYFLKGREEIIKIRQKRYRLAQSKWKIAQKAIRFLRFVPFIKMIAVCNTLAYNNSKEESDIDFFIITKSKRIWTSRFFSILAIWLLGLRPRHNEVKDKICLSFYITEDQLNLRKIALNPYDIYLTYWIDQIIPLVNREKIYTKFLENNLWKKNFLPCGIENISRREISDDFLSDLVRNFLEKILGLEWADSLEKLFKKIQLFCMSPVKKSLAQKLSTEVIISDKILKFHEKDSRAEFRKRFENKLTCLSKLNGKNKKTN